VTADKVLAEFAHAEQAVTCLQFNPETLTIASGSTDKSVRFWDLVSMKLINQTA
jgi:WD40 repeat protein